MEEKKVNLEELILGILNDIQSANRFEPALTPETSVKDMLRDYDSLDQIELIMAIEEDLYDAGVNFEFEDEEIEHLMEKTEIVNDWIAFIKEKVERNQ